LAVLCIPTGTVCKGRFCGDGMGGTQDKKQCCFVPVEMQKVRGVLPGQYW
jgi:hypothetical protein